MIAPVVLAIALLGAVIPLLGGGAVQRSLPEAMIVAEIVAAWGLLGAIRWAIAKPINFSAPMVATRAGALPPGMVTNLFRSIRPAGPRRLGLPLSPGTYVALAALNRVVDPCSKRGFADWWRTTAADRFARIRAPGLDHRRLWDAMHALPLEALAGIEHELALRVCDRFALDTSSLALDMTNFATFIDTGNAKAPIAQRGKAKQKRADLRLVGLGLVVTRTGGIPLLSHAYPGNKPDVTQFPDMITTLAGRHAVLTAAHPTTEPAGPEMHARQVRGYRHHPGRSRPAPRRAGRHPGPRQDPLLPQVKTSGKVDRCLK